MKILAQVIVIILVCAVVEYAAACFAEVRVRCQEYRREAERCEHRSLAEHRAARPFGCNPEPGCGR